MQFIFDFITAPIANHLESIKIQNPVFKMSKNKFNSRVVVSATRALYLDVETADIFGSERISAHKTLLVAASKVFRAMFNGQWEEKDEVISNVSAADFKTFLQYFYFDETEKLSINQTVLLKEIICCKLYGTSVHDAEGDLCIFKVNSLSLKLIHLIQME